MIARDRRPGSIDNRPPRKMTAANSDGTSRPGPGMTAPGPRNESQKTDTLKKFGSKIIDNLKSRIIDNLKETTPF